MSSVEPVATTDRSGIGLCLSGGGFRAALFHLGAVRRLHELGVLAQIKTISSVSGGSIFSAHLARSIPWPSTAVDFEKDVAVPFRAFTSRDIRTRPILQGALPFFTAVELLVQQYERFLTPQKLSDLPDAPRFVFCSTDRSYGVNFVFEKRLLGDYQIGYQPTSDAWSVARAVAASSCFPPVFNPMEPKLDGKKLVDGWATPGSERDRCISELRLTDGGNYDNMGLEPVWKDHSHVLVSDGGGLFDSVGDRNFFTRLLRYTAIVERQALSVRKRWLISSFVNEVFGGGYWGIGGAREHYGVTGGYSADVAHLIGSIRTDLDAFSEAEAFVLENHGYALADATLQKHSPQLITTPAAFNLPHPEWSDEARVHTALRNSGQRKMFGRG